VHHNGDKVVTIVTTTLSVVPVSVVAIAGSLNSLDVVRNQVISDTKHIDAEGRQAFHYGMLVNVWREIHVYLIDGERRLGTDGVASDHEVAIDIPDIVLVTVCGLLNDRISV
jgi:hypothetical protein